MDEGFYVLLPEQGQTQRESGRQENLVVAKKTTEAETA